MPIINLFICKRLPTWNLDVINHRRGFKSIKFCPGVIIIGYTITTRPPASCHHLVCKRTGYYKWHSWPKCMMLKSNLHKVTVCRITYFTIQHQDLQCQQVLNNWFFIAQNPTFQKISWCFKYFHKVHNISKQNIGQNKRCVRKITLQLQQ